MPEYGAEQEVRLADCALRMRVRRSPMGSLTGDTDAKSREKKKKRKDYQEDFVMPGMRPSVASSRKQMRQRANFRMNARGRPQRRQRLCCWVENFGGRDDFTILDVLATCLPLPVRLRSDSGKRDPKQLQQSPTLFIIPG